MKNLHFLFCPEIKFFTKNANFFHEEKTGWRQCALIFVVDVYMHPPEPDPLPRVWTP